jgi:hypothetical protein
MRNGGFGRRKDDDRGIRCQQCSEDLPIRMIEPNILSATALFSSTHLISTTTSQTSLIPYKTYINQRRFRLADKRYRLISIRNHLISIPIDRYRYLAYIIARDPQISLSFYYYILTSNYYILNIASNLDSFSFIQST